MNRPKLSDKAGWSTRNSLILCDTNILVPALGGAEQQAIHVSGPPSRPPLPRFVTLFMDAKYEWDGHKLRDYFDGIAAYCLQPIRHPTFMMVSHWSWVECRTRSSSSKISPFGYSTMTVLPP